MELATSVPIFSGLRGKIESPQAELMARFLNES